MIYQRLIGVNRVVVRLDGLLSRLILLLVVADRPLDGSQLTVDGNQLTLECISGRLLRGCLGASRVRPGNRLRRVELRQAGTLGRADGLARAFHAGRASRNV